MKRAHENVANPDLPTSFRLCSYAMSESATTPGIKSASSFASLLESFTSLAKNNNETWNDTALLDDVATISYEQALRSHRRVPSVDALPEVRPQPRSAQVTPTALSAAKDRKRKTASITIRLTESEEAQLHERAAAAQLSVSAYLRSCILEAEALRTQVKDTLAQMRSAASVTNMPSTTDKPSPSRFNIWAKWRPRLRKL
jgi:hypothetical protein